MKDKENFSNFISYEQPKLFFDSNQIIPLDVSNRM